MLTAIRYSSFQQSVIVFSALAVNYTPTLVKKLHLFCTAPSRFLRFTRWSKEWAYNLKHDSNASCLMWHLRKPLQWTCMFYSILFCRGFVVYARLPSRLTSRFFVSNSMVWWELESCFLSFVLFWLKRLIVLELCFLVQCRRCIP